METYWNFFKHSTYRSSTYISLHWRQTFTNTLQFSLIAWYCLYNPWLYPSGFTVNPKCNSQRCFFLNLLFPWLTWGEGGTKANLSFPLLSSLKN